MPQQQQQQTPRGGRGGSNNRGGYRGGGRGGGGFTPYGNGSHTEAHGQPSGSPPRGGGGFQSPPHPGRGGRGGRGGGFSPSPGPYRGGANGGGGGGYGGPHFTSGSPQHPHQGGGGGYSTPTRSHSAGFHRGGGAAGGGGSGGRFQQPSFGHGSGGKHFGSPHQHHHGSSSTLIPLGQFNLDERTRGNSVAVSVKMGAAGLEDAHMTPVVVAFLRDQLQPFLRSHYALYAREQIQLNLELQDNFFTSQGVETLCEHLCATVSSASAPYRLSSLKLWNNQIGDPGCLALARLLTVVARCDAPLSELHLSHNQVTEEGAAAIFSAVYEYTRPDSKLTKLDPRGAGAAAGAGVEEPAAGAVSQAAASSSSAATTTSPFVLPASCVDTGLPLPPSLYPLWLRLEWNQINFALFAPQFSWLSLEPAALRREAKKQRRQAQHAAAAAAAAATSGAASTGTPSRQVSGQSVAEQEEEDQEDEKGEESSLAVARNAQEDDSADEVDEANQGDDGAPLRSTEDEDPSDALAALSLQPASSSSSSPSASPSSDPAAAVPAPAHAKSLSFPLPPPELRICPASNRTLCTVRSCKYGTVAPVHVCFFHLQHQSYQESDLLDQLKKQRKNRKVMAKPAALSERGVSAEGKGDATSAVPAATGTALTSAASASPSSSPSAATAAGAGARPLVLFLDTNSVFGMISERAETRVFHWNNLLSLALAGRFGSCFAEADRHVYIVLCSAVLNEIDARKEYSKKASAEGGQFGPQRFAHLSTLARQIKAQFQMNAPDPSQGFMARAKNLGGTGRGFLKTVSIAQGEMNVHPSLRPSSTDTRNTSNDRRILNAALHWTQSIAETGCVVLLTDDRNLTALAASEQVPCVGLYALDRALQRPELAARVLDSVTIREAMRSCSAELDESLAHETARPAPRMDKNVYECLQEAVQLLEEAQASPDQRVQRSADEIADLLDCWKGVLANAPQLLTTLRNNRNSASVHGSPQA